MEEHATQHETAFFRSFIIRERRERYLSKLASRRHRRRFLNRLNHQFHRDLDARFIRPGMRPWPTGIDQCYMIADEAQFDQQLATAAEAAHAVSAAHFGIVVSFIPGHLACYKDESPSDFVWLERE